MTTHRDDNTHNDTHRGTQRHAGIGTGAVDVFADPVRFLADLGITAEVVAETSLPAAA